MIKDGSVIRTELALWAGIITTLLFLVFGDRWVADLSNLLWYSLLFVWLFVVIAWLAFSVVRHADALAILLGEPYGTIILTLSVIVIEVAMISAVMLTGADNPTLARDTLFSVLMIVLNGMFVGASRRRTGRELSNFGFSARAPSNPHWSVTPSGRLRRPVLVSPPPTTTRGT